MIATTINWHLARLWDATLDFCETHPWLYLLLWVGAVTLWIWEVTG